MELKKLLLSKALPTTTSNYYLEKSPILDKYQPSSQFSNHHQHNLSTLASHLQQIAPALSPEIIEQQSLILPIPSDFMICLNDRHCCICLPTTEENITKRIAGIDGNIWIPMYVSFLNCPPIFGEAAKRDMNIEPEFVVYDILNLISLPYSEIEIKHEWAFNIAYTGEVEKHTVIEIQTWKGIYKIMPINVLALIFVGLHKEAERVSGKRLKSVFVKTTKTQGRIDKDAIRNAVKIARLECTGVKSMPALNVY
uniref:Uncharacterized protein n=1 Tax=Panagrolaimus davidi TaxID=227884 RepID=A0A914Q4N5_9BILA